MELYYFDNMMIENEAILLGYLESILGKSKKTARNNYSFICPNGCHPTKHKLEINLDTQQYQCWICGGEKNGYKGKSIIHLLKQVKAPQQKIEQIKQYIPSSSEYKQKEEIKDEKIIELPKEYKPLYPFPSDIIARHALAYLKKRRFTIEDIIKYNVGYCSEGKYRNRIIIPLYDEKGQLNYFEARSFDNSSLHYLKPDISRNIIPNDYLINWDLPIILCEGVFDMIAIKRNVIPLLGKNIQTELMKKLITSKVKKIYIALDQDALKRALQFCEELMRSDKEVYLVEMNDKDASKIGFQKFTELIQTIQPLTYSKLLEYKLKRI